MKANSVEEFFGTLLQSVTEAHKKHLMTGKYSSHKALNEFYDEMPELVDALIEHWQGTNGKVEKYENSLLATDMDTIKYLEELMDMCEDAKKTLFDDQEALCSDIDDIIGQISSTLYQLRELKEHRMISLQDYLMESLIQESNISAGIRKAGVTKQVDQECLDAAVKFASRVGINPSKIYLFWSKCVNAETSYLGKRFIAKFDETFKTRDNGNSCPEIDKIIAKLNKEFSPNKPLYTDYSSWLKTYWNVSQAQRDVYHRTFEYIIRGSKQPNDGKVKFLGYGISPVMSNGREVEKASIYVILGYEDIE